MQTRVAGIEMKWPSALITCTAGHVKIGGKGAIDGDGKSGGTSTGRRGGGIRARGLRWASITMCSGAPDPVYKSTDIEVRG